MGKHHNNSTDQIPVEQAFPDGRAPTSPNDPANKAAAEAKGAAEVLALRHAQEARRDAVVRGETD